MHHFCTRHLFRGRNGHASCLADFDCHVLKGQILGIRAFFL
jgi:hypothetical protein